LCIRSTEPAGFLGVDLGDATVQRTVGGRVTPAVLRDVAYISYLTETTTPDGPWWELAVIHHTDCGSILLADPELRRGFAARGGHVEPTPVGQH
jgi:carbonic anhydrase